MKIFKNKIVNAILFSTLFGWTSAYAVQTTGLEQMSDQELSDIQGQALFSLSYLAPGDANNTYTTSNGNIGFYTLGMEAEVRLNANIKTLQLGCGGVNGYGGCDLDIENFSLGCIANANDVCITLPKTYANQPNGAAQEASGNIPISPTNSTQQNSPATGTTTQTKLKDFVIDNPFFQFAIEAPEDTANRKIVGFRVGGAQVTGPMSIGTLNSYSGYLTGQVALDMQEQGKGRNPNDVAVTCGTDSAPCPGSLGGTGYNAFGYTGDRTMGLANDQGCVLFICEEFKNLTISFDGATRNATATANGSRLSRVMVSGLDLGVAVDGIVDSLSFVQSDGLSAGLLNIIKGLIQNQVKEKIKNQLASGLGTSVTALQNNTYQMPFNLSNVHQLDVNSRAFGLALSSRSIQYPGYAAAVPQGWSLHMPDSFVLNISEPTTRLVNNIVGGAGRDGNISLLAAPYRNCYGSLTFC